MEKVRLFYFEGVRGRAECIRMVLTAAGVEFEDIQIKRESWLKDPKVKKEAPYGQLPYVIYQGKKIAQTVPIATYFAKKYGFYGTSEEDALRQEVVMHLAEDMSVPHFRNWVTSQDADQKAEMEKKMKTDLFPRYLRYFEDLLEENGANGFFVGEKVTLADMLIYNLLETVLGIDTDALKTFLHLQKLRDNVKAVPALKDYLVNRTKSPV